MRKADAGITRGSCVSKVAFVGSDRINRVLGRFVIMAFGRNSIRFFDTDEEAGVWLEAWR